MVNPTPIKNRLIAKTRKTKTCWFWLGSLNPFGYGRISAGVGKRNRPVTTHRASWEAHFGPIPQGKQVLHKCDNPSCVNPEHLFLGTHKENMKDKCKKGRNVVRKLTPEKVKEIRQVFETLTRRPYKILANRFRVSEQTIHDIITRKTWIDL